MKGVKAYPYESSEKPKQGRGTYVLKDLYDSTAFWELKGRAPQLLIRFLGKRQRNWEKDCKGAKSYDWTNLQNLTMTYKELECMWENPLTHEKSGLTQPTITRAIDELLGKGFLEVKNPGGAYKQDKAVYALIENWKWWAPKTVFNRRNRDVHRGYQGQNRRTASQAVEGYHPEDNDGMTEKKHFLHTETLPIHTYENVAEGTALRATETLPKEKTRKCVQIQ